MHDTLPDRPIASSDPEETFGRRLLHRWFVEYNPLYLLSASLVLGGMFLLSRGLAHEGSLHGPLGVAAIAELYALALIGGAALLTRIGHRRPAVMLALLTVLYQLDLTLHTETCAHLGLVGVWATSVWIGLFAVKLHALAWAMKLRLARRAFATSMLGGLGLAVLPHVLFGVTSRTAGAIVALWLCALTSLWRSGGVTSLVPLDAWGETVVRRAVRATWLLSGFLLTLHVLFWTLHYSLELSTLVAVAPLFAVRWMRSESRVWALAGATLLVAAYCFPASFASAALVSAIVLALRAGDSIRGLDASVVAQAVVVGATSAGPYRMVGADRETSAPASATAQAALRVVTDARAATVRLLTGAAFALYLSAWSMDWTGGPWPAHVLALDIVFTTGAVLAFWRARARVSAVPLIASWTHFAVKIEVLVAPRTALGWGGAAVAGGFALLIASLATSYWLRPARASSKS
jgi:hypothetical protein